MALDDNDPQQQQQDQQYDPRKLNPLPVSGDSWASMAPALIPAALGAILSGGHAPLGSAVAGLTGGAAAIQTQRDKNIQYNNQLEEQRQRQLIAQREMQIRERSLTLSEQEAQRQTELFKQTKQMNDIKLNQELTSQKARDAKGQQILQTEGQDAYDRFILDPESRIKADNEIANRKAKAATQGPVLDAMMKEGKISLGGMSGTKAVEAWGDNALQQILELQKIKQADVTMSLERQKVGLAGAQLALEAQKLNEPKILWSDKNDNLLLVSQRDPKTGQITTKMQTPGQFLGLPPDWQSAQANRKTLEDMESAFNKNLLISAQYNGDFNKYLISSQGQAQFAMRSGADPAKVMPMIQAQFDLEQRIDQQATSQARDWWMKNGSGMSSSEDSFQSWLKGNEGKQVKDAYTNAIKTQRQQPQQAPTTGTRLSEIVAGGGAAPAAAAPARAPAPAPRPQLPGQAQVEQRMRAAQQRERDHAQIVSRARVLARDDGMNPNAAEVFLGKYIDQARRELGK